MKTGIFLIVLGIILIMDGTLRFTLVGIPGLTGLIFAVPSVYFGIRRIRKSGGKNQSIN